MHQQIKLSLGEQKWAVVKHSKIITKMIECKKIANWSLVKVIYL